MKSVFRLFLLAAVAMMTGCGGGESSRDIGVTRFTLSNGLPVHVIPVHQNPVVSTTFLFHVGLKHETPEINGVSHLLEHLTFNGTDRHNQAAFYDAIDRVGAYVNASTGEDYTAYYLLAPTETFESALDLQLDMLFHATIPEDKIAKEKGIVLEEIRGAKVRPTWTESRLLRTFMYPGSAYAMEVLGSVDSVEAIPREAIVDFYTRFYAADNAVLLVTGDISPEQARDVLEARVSRMRTSGLEQERSTLALEDQPEVAVVSGKGLRTGLFTYAVPGISPADPNALAQDVAIELLDSALKRELADIDPRAGASLDATSDYSRITVSVRLSENMNRETGEKLRKKIRQIAAALPFTREDLDRKLKKKQMEARILLERPHFFGMMAAFRLGAGDTDFLAENPATMEQVTAVLKGIAEPERSRTLVLGTEAGGDQ